MNSTPNESLQIEQIPEPNATWEEISHFALTCNGYEEAGSFEECSRIANARMQSTLSELRICLFFEQRRWRILESIPTIML